MLSFLIPKYNASDPSDNDRYLIVQCISELIFVNHIYIILSVGGSKSAALGDTQIGAGQSQMEWTEERVETLRMLWTEGNTASEVSRRLGVTRNAVIGKVHRLGMGGRQTPAAPRAIAAQTPRRNRAHSPWTRAAPQLAPPPPRPRLEPADLAPTANLMGLNEHSCRWPIGHPNDLEFGFCGRERQRNLSYCADHRKIALRCSSFSSGDLDKLAAIR